MAEISRQNARSCAKIELRDPITTRAWLWKKRREHFGCAQHTESDGRKGDHCGVEQQVALQQGEK